MTTQNAAILEEWRTYLDGDEEEALTRLEEELSALQGDAESLASTVGSMTTHVGQLADSFTDEELDWIELHQATVDRVEEQREALIESRDRHDAEIATLEGDRAGLLEVFDAASVNDERALQRQLRANSLTKQEHYDARDILNEAIDALDARQTLGESSELNAQSEELERQKSLAWQLPHEHKALAEKLVGVRAQLDKLREAMAAVQPEHVES